MRQNSSQLMLRFLILSLLLNAGVKAESSNPSPSPAAQSTQIQPVQAPKPASRSSDSGQAKMMAMAGAAMAMTMCTQMMNEAQKARSSGDQKSAQMYMMMAMQQCQQGAQSMANANENGKQKDDLQENQTPQMAQLSPQQAPKYDEVQKPDLSALNATPTPSADTPSEDPEVVKWDSPAIDNPNGNALTPKVAKQGDETTIPNLINNAQLNGAETPKTFDDGTATAATPAMNTFAGFVRSGSSDDLKKKAAEEAAPAPGRGEGGSKGGGDSYADGSSPSGSGKEGGSDGGGMNLTDMMSSMFGGGAQGAPGMGFAGQGLIDYTPAPVSAATGKRMNIFEAASELYKQSQGKRLKKYRLSHVIPAPKATKLANLSK